MNTRLCLSVFVFVAILSAASASTPLATADAPPFPAREAAILGDAYVAKKFPQFPTLYCADISYETNPMIAATGLVWRLTYYLPNNPRKEIQGSPFADWGVCLVFIDRDKSVRHTTEPKQNPPIK